MTVRTRLRLVTVVALLCAVAAISASIHLILARGVVRLETDEVERATRQTAQLIREQINQLGATNSDWAIWDATYRYIKDKNTDYAQLMLTDESLLESNIEILIYIARDGSVVFAKGLNLRTEKTEPIPKNLWPHLAPGSEILRRCLRKESPSGLLLLPEGVFLLTARPILPTRGQAEPDGMLVMARSVQPGEWKYIASYPAVSVSVQHYNDSHLPASSVELRRRLTHDLAVVEAVDRDLVAGYTAFPDIYGNPALIVRTELLRTMYQAANNNLFSFGIVLMSLAALFGIAINLILEKLVTSRLSVLSARLREIAQDGEASARITLAGHDELSQVAEDINGVLHTLQQSQDALRDSESQLRTIVEAMHTGFLIIEADTHTITDANAAAVRLIGAPESEVIGATCHQFVCHAEADRCPMHHLGEQVFNSERILVNARGEHIPVLITAVTVTLGNTRYIVENLIDISERKRSEDAVRHQAYHDSLTGLPNRAHLYERLTETLHHASLSGAMLAVLFLDLDRFKTINDTLGHALGDALLREVSGRLKECLRADDMIARLGGDEFAIILPEIERPELAAIVARRVLDALRLPFPVNGYELHTSTSIGISIYPKDGLEAEQLLQGADIALYHAKDQGRNTFRFYDTWINATTRERLSLENDLRHAVEREELVVFYQPQVHVPSGRIIGMEALLRWQHPEMGLLMPDRFIGIAEETGLIEPIGEWVMREACTQLRAWQDAGLIDGRVAVNLSPIQFHQRNLAHAVHTVLTDTGLDPSDLELEITENTAMRNVDFSVKLMASLKAMGVRLCLDDFGVGYTSLVYLKQFPLDTVKIDRMFLASLQHVSSDAAIVSAIIGIARSLQLGIIGEGVETEPQLRFLLSHGCKVMQGYLFSRPVSANTMGELLQERLADLMPPVID